jgi:hypothetical protein
MTKGTKTEFYGHGPRQDAETDPKNFQIKKFFGKKAIKEHL